MTQDGTRLYEDFRRHNPVPPLVLGAVDEARVRWFEHPELLTTEVTVADGYAVLIGRRRAGGCAATSGITRPGA